MNKSAVINGNLMDEKFGPYLDHAEKLKENVRRYRAGLPPLGQLGEGNFNLCSAICGACCPCLSYAEHKRGLYRERKFPKSRMLRMICEGSLENAFLKVFLGWSTGIFISFFWWWCNIYNDPKHRQSMTYSSIVLGSLLCFLLGVTYRGRMLFLLMIPTAGSKNFRSYLRVTMFIMVISGPYRNCIMNVLKNGETLYCISKSMGDQKGVAKTSDTLPVGQFVRQLSELCKQLTTISIRSQKLENIYNKAKNACLRVRLQLAKVMRILGNACDPNPFGRCMRAIWDVNKACWKNVKFPKNLICILALILFILCPSVQIFSLACQIGRLLTRRIKREINEILTALKKSVVRMFWFHITLEYHYSYSFQTNKDVGLVGDLIQEALKAHLDIFKVFLNFMPRTLGAVSVVLMSFSAIFYYINYKKRIGYDNKVVSFYVRDVDERQREIDPKVPRLFPLTSEEKSKHPTNYFRIQLFTGTYYQIYKQINAIVTLFYSIGHLCVFVLCDYLYFFLASNVNRIFREMSESFNANRNTLHIDVKGREGFVKAMFDRLNVMLNVIDEGSRVLVEEIAFCLADPNPVDWPKNKRILIIAYFLMVATFFGDSAKSLRAAIADYYNPKMAQKRAIRLYNILMRKRNHTGSKIITNIKSGPMGSVAETQITYKTILMKKCPGCCMCIWVKLQWAEAKCINCGSVGEAKEELFVNCDTDTCKETYCIVCCKRLNNICTFCSQDIKLDSDPNLDIERDSSDERERLNSKATKTAAEIEYLLSLDKGDEIIKDMNFDENILEDDGRKREKSKDSKKANLDLFRNITNDRIYSKDEYGITGELEDFCVEKGIDPEYLDVYIEEYERLGFSKKKGILGKMGVLKANLKEKKEQEKLKEKIMEEKSALDLELKFTDKIVERLEKLD